MSTLTTADLQQFCGGQAEVVIGTLKYRGKIATITCEPYPGCLDQFNILFDWTATEGRRGVWELDKHVRGFYTPVVFCGQQHGEDGILQLTFSYDQGDPCVVTLFLPGDEANIWTRRLTGDAEKDALAEALFRSLGPTEPAFPGGWNSLPADRVNWDILGSARRQGVVDEYCDSWNADSSGADNPIGIEPDPDEPRVVTVHLNDDFWQF